MSANDRLDAMAKGVVMVAPSVEKSFCTTRQAAELLGVSVGTVQLWVESGLLEAWKTSGGHRRVLRDSIDGLLRRKGDPGATPPGFALTPAPAHAPVPAPVMPASTRRPSIMVVEDDVQLLRRYEIELSRWPMAPRVITVGNAVSALLMIGRCPPDLLITDLQLPGMDGFNMLRVLRSTPEIATTQIVVVSALGGPDIEARGGLPSGIVVLAKPVPFDRLLDITRQVVASSLFVTQDSPVPT
jgi:excisionase family DNA binding protein